MTLRTTARSLAAGALLTLATLGTGAYADGVVEVDDALAAKIQQEIRRQPPSGGDLSGVTVQAENGVLVLNGFVEGLESHRAVHDVLKNIDGLHLNQIDDHLIQQ